MKIYSITLVLVLCIGMSMYADEVHKIKKGETLYQLANEYGVPVDILLEANDISNPNLVSEGLSLQIPTDSQTGSNNGSQTTSATMTYKVKKGDTLYSIAHDHNITLYTLRKYNTKVPDNITIGQVITLPTQKQNTIAKKTTKSLNTAVAESNSFGVLNKSDLLNNSKSIGRISGEWPIAGNGYILEGKLPGMLIEGKEGAPVISSHAGVVVYASLHTSFRNVIVIQGDDGLVYVYAGQKDIVVKQGERVNKGTMLGHLGIMPTLQRPVLYFSLWDKEKSIDPRRFIKG